MPQKAKGNREMTGSEGERTEIRAGFSPVVRCNSQAGRLNSQRNTKTSELGCKILRRRLKSSMAKSQLGTPINSGPSGLKSHVQEDPLYRRGYSTRSRLRIRALLPEARLLETAESMRALVGETFREANEGHEELDSEAQLGFEGSDEEACSVARTLPSSDAWTLDPLDGNSRRDPPMETARASSAWRNAIYVSNCLGGKVSSGTRIASCLAGDVAMNADSWGDQNGNNPQNYTILSGLATGWIEKRNKPRTNVEEELETETRGAVNVGKQAMESKGIRCGQCNRIEKNYHAP
ncbi:hypothetical protein BJ322DRAFT_1022174 [Thelephora terrestris]|uniref:Uncharacterized protein n=1 Tax=Thelephora terrestris TaxID=56493 RepID=A0A9P6HC85_9AGAM|nr:hypothetical protein BJ322DRAFT_1022174 [Thelephora terrestris]